MKLNWLILTIGTALLAVSTVFEINYLDYGSPIPFRNIQTITFKDFKGYAKPGLTLDGMNEFAYISTNREAAYISDTSIEITTYFHPSRSYIYKQNIRSNELLTHELYHFHIAEYHSRLIRAKINKFENDLSGRELNSILKSYNLLERLMQTLYDDESYHGYILAQQKNWEHLLDSLMLSVEQYSNPIVTFNR